VTELVCVDASFAVKWVLPEEHSPEARTMLDDALRRKTRLVAPPHFAVEVTSAIYKKLRDRLITLDEAKECLRQFGFIAIETVWPASLAERSLEIAAELGWPYPYDAFYLALAEALGCQLWTADERLHRDARDLFSVFLLSQ